MTTMTPAEALEILRGLHSRCECAGQRVVQDAVGIAVDAIEECEGLRARVADLETLCDEGADAYNHAVERMEEWHERRMREGKPRLYAAGLCDHLYLVRNHVESLEGERDKLRARIAELERQPIRWRPISEAPKDCEVLLWSSFYKLAFLGEWSATGAWVDAHGEKIKDVTKFAEVAWPEGESC